jgi:hypothetical protein
MTKDISARIDHWVRKFQEDPRLADEVADVLGELIVLDGGKPSEAASILMAALGRFRESQP